MELRSPLRAVLSAACAASLLETLAAYARGAGHHPGYYATALVVSLLFAGLIGLGGAAFLKTRQAVALWVLAGAALVHGGIASLAFGVTVFALASASAVQRIGETRFGLVVGAAFAVTGIAGAWLGSATPAGWPMALAPTLLFLALLLPALLLSRWLPPAIRSRSLLAALAALVLLGAGFEVRREVTGPVPRDEAGGPHVFLLVLDTVRADHLSVYGYERDTTPRLARRIANQPGAVVYPWAFSNGTWTGPSHATLLTGLLPSEHDATWGTPEAESMDWFMPTRFALQAERTLAERFQEKGYATLAAFANPWLDRIEDMDRGFDFFRVVSQKGPLPLMVEALRERFTPSLFLDVVDFTAPASAVSGELLSAIDAAPAANLFVLANFLDAHAPYRPPPGSRGRYAGWSPFEHPQSLAIDLPAEDMDRLTARHDESLHALDAQLDAFLDALDRRGILDRSWVFITSDHGEAFGEHGVTDHGTAVYNEIVRVPLIVFPPAGHALQATDAPVSLVSVAATAAAIAGAPLAGDADLRSDAPGSAVVEFYADPAKARTHGLLGREPAQALVTGSRKLIRYRGREELYDLSADPGEHRDLAAQEPDVVRRLGGSLPVLEWKRADSAIVVDDAAMRARLEALGYLESD